MLFINNRLVNVIILVLLAELSCNLGCMKVVTKKTGSQVNSNYTIYNVFDSLDYLLCTKVEDIKASFPQNRDSIFIVIQPSGNFNSLEVYESGEMYKYKIGVFCKQTQQQNLIIKSARRKIKICGNLYPIYFNYIDNIFCLPDSLKNKMLQTDYFVNNLNMYKDKYIEVDMIGKKIICDCK